MNLQFTNIFLKLNDNVHYTIICCLKPPSILKDISTCPQMKFDYALESYWKVCKRATIFKFFMRLNLIWEWHGFYLCKSEFYNIPVNTPSNFTKFQDVIYSRMSSIPKYIEPFHITFLFLSYNNCMVKSS